MIKEFAAKEKLEIVQSERVASAGGRKGGLGGILPAGRQVRPPYKFWAKSVRIFSNAHRQLGNEVIGSPATRARQPFFGEISSCFEFSIKRAFLEIL